MFELLDPDGLQNNLSTRSDLVSAEANQPAFVAWSNHHTGTAWCVCFFGEEQSRPGDRLLGFRCGWVPESLIDTADHRYKSGYCKEWYKLEVIPLDAKYGCCTFSADPAQDHAPNLPAKPLAPPLDFTVLHTSSDNFSTSNSRFKYKLPKRAWWDERKMMVTVLHHVHPNEKCWTCHVPHTSNRQILIGTRALQFLPPT